jgi:hypothetical protein
VPLPEGFGTYGGSVSDELGDMIRDVRNDKESVSPGSLIADCG